MAKTVSKEDALSRYDIILKYTEKGESEKVIKMQINAFDKIQGLRPNRKLIANAQLAQGSSPMVAYAIAKFSTHIAAGLM